MKVKTVFVFVVAALMAALLAPAASAADGKALYEAKCAMCHGKDGVAKPMAKGSRSFNDPEYQKAESADSIAALVTAGKGKMPAYADKLKDEEIRAIATYVKTLAK